MASVNKVILVGNIGRDADVRETKKGDVILNFSVATSEKWDGGEDTQWHNVDVFGKLANAIKDYVKKGRQIYVEGQLVHEEWLDKDGNKRNKSKVKVGFNGKVVLLGKAGQGSQEEAQERIRPARGSESGSGTVVPDDDVPF
jgi:single-strand DNA-binding protein